MTSPIINPTKNEASLIQREASSRRDARIDAMLKMMETQATQIRQLQQVVSAMTVDRNQLVQRLARTESAQVTLDGNVAKALRDSSTANQVLDGMQASKGLIVERQGPWLRLSTRIPDADRYGSSMKTIEYCPDTNKTQHNALQLVNVEALSGGVASGDDRKVPYILFDGSAVGTLNWQWIATHSNDDPSLGSPATTQQSATVNGVTLMGNTLTVALTNLDISIQNGTINVKAGAGSSNSQDLSGLIPDEALSAAEADALTDSAEYFDIVAKSPDGNTVIFRLYWACLKSARLLDGTDVTAAIKIE